MKKKNASVTLSHFKCTSVAWEALGKSFLIEAVKAYVDYQWPSDDCKCAITAPTGLAAFNVGSVTIYRLFQLPIEHEGREAGY